MYTYSAHNPSYSSSSPASDGEEDEGRDAHRGVVQHVHHRGAARALRRGFEEQRRRRKALAAEVAVSAHGKRGRTRSGPRSQLHRVARTHSKLVVRHTRRLPCFWTYLDRSLEKD